MADQQLLFTAHFLVCIFALTLYHLRMTSDRPGVVFARKYAADPEVEISVMKKGAALEGQLPERLLFLGLTQKECGTYMSK